jgi:hypothetical protein
VWVFVPVLDILVLVRCHSFMLLVMFFFVDKKLLLDSTVLSSCCMNAETFCTHESLFISESCSLVITILSVFKLSSSLTFCVTRLI